MLSAALGVLGRYLGRIILTTAAAVLIYVAIKVVKKIFNAYREVFVMWTVMLGRRWMPQEKSLRVQPYLCKTADLDEVSIEECFQFHCSAFQPAEENITRDQVLELYRKILRAYSHVLFIREKLDGSLRGLGLMGVEYKKTHTLVKVGVTMTHKNYRGGPWIYMAATGLIIKELLLHPFVPVYIIAKISTYKSYLATTIVPNSQPRYDQEAPEEYKQIAEDFVCGVQLPGDEYDRETFVLRRRTVVVNEHLVSISERELLNPHIRFYNERNPGWRKGDQLVVMARISWQSLLQHVFKVMIRRLKPRSSRSNLPRGNAVGGIVNRKKVANLRSRLARGLTYQDIEAELHSLRFHVLEQNEEEQLKKTNSFINRLYSHSDDEDLNIDL